jgi:hypothetical protein
VSPTTATVAPTASSTTKYGAVNNS